MKTIKKGLSVIMALLLLLPLLPAGVTDSADAAGLAAGTVVYYEDFNYADNSTKSSVLSTLGWKTATGLRANQTNYSITGGRLLCDSVTSSATGDSYVTVLNDTQMSEVVQGDYTISYKLTYVEANSYTRYSCLIYNYNGYKSYNSVHLRIAGYGNNQVRTAPKWYTYDSSSSSYYLAATGTSSLSYKLFGVQAASANATTNTNYPLVGKELTVRIAVDKDAGPTVYVNGTKVSTPTTTYKELFLSTQSYASAIALKTSQGTKAYMDDFMVYTGLGAIPSVKKSDVNYTFPTDDAKATDIKVMTFNTLFSDQDADVFGNGITRTYHMANVVTGYRPDIVGFQERNAKNLSGMTTLITDNGGYAAADNYRTDTTSSVVTYTPILYNTNRFTLVANDATNNNKAHGSLLFDKSYNVKDLTAAERKTFAGTKCLAWAVLKDKKTGGYVLALNAHFALNTSSYTNYTDAEALEARLSNAAQGIEIMKELYGYYGVMPTFFTGDFNMRFYDPAYKSLSEYFESSIYGTESAIRYEYSMNKVTGYDFTRAPNAPIDHIFYTDESMVAKSYYVGNKNPESMIASDHLPVMATFGYAAVEAPTYSHVTDMYSGIQHVTIDGEGTVYYTTDDSDPKASPTRKLYGEAISVSDDTVIKSRALVNGVYSDISRVALFYKTPIYITEVIKNAPGTDHTEGFEIYNASEFDLYLSDFYLWSYSNATESTCLSVADSSVESQLPMAHHSQNYILPAGEIGFCPFVFGEHYLTKDTIGSGNSQYLVTLNEDGTEVTYHRDRFAAALAYNGSGTIPADRIFPIDRTARSIGYTDSGTAVRRLDYYNSTDGSANDISRSFNLGNSTYSRLYITFAHAQSVADAICICNMDSTDGGITTTNGTTSVQAGAHSFVPSSTKTMVTDAFTKDAYTVGSFTASQKTAFAALAAERRGETGTAIYDAADFAAMSASGSYYLAADITLSATYTTVFKGTLDGRGHTVTTSVPMFTDMSGTVKNLTVKGNIAVASGYNGAIATMVTGNARFEDIVIEANLSGGSSTGGLAGYGKGGNSIVALRCINKGNHSGTSQTGGFIGYSQGNTAMIDECINYGNISSTSYSGGIICRFGKDAATLAYKCNITNCINYGDVSSTKTRAGGVIGYSVGTVTISGCINYGHIFNSAAVADFSAGGIYAEGSGTYASGTTTVNTKNNIIIDDCYNHGKIEAVSTAGGIMGRTPSVAPATGGLYVIEDCGNTGEIICVDGGSGKSVIGAGGIVGYFYATVDHRIARCYNVGTVKVTAAASGATIRAAGIASYFNNAKAYFEECYNAGTISASGTGAVAYQLYYNKNATGGGTSYINNNHALAVSGATYETNGTQAASYTTFTAAELANGTLRDRINSGAGETVYYQNTAAEAYPVLREYKGFDLFGIVLKDEAEYKESATAVYRVKAGTTGEEFKDSFRTKVWVLNGTAPLGLGAYMKTGLTVASFDESEKLYVAVIGDTDRDGAITAADYIDIRARLKSGRSADELTELASDMNDDGTLTSTDCLTMLLEIKG